MVLFGLHSAPATFQRSVDGIIESDIDLHSFLYLDDIIVTGNALTEHLENLKVVFAHLRSFNFQNKPQEIWLGRKETKYIDHVVEQKGIKTDGGKVKPISHLKMSKNLSV